MINLPKRRNRSIAKPVIGGQIVVFNDADTGKLSYKSNDGSVRKLSDENTVLPTTALADGSVTERKLKAKAIVTLADAAAVLSCTDTIDAGIFTITPTIARILTTDTAVDILGAIDGASVGVWSDFSITVLAAFNVTLAAGVGVTIIGNAVLNNRSGTFKLLVTSDTTISIIRQD